MPLSEKDEKYIDDRIIVLATKAAQEIIDKVVLGLDDKILLLSAKIAREIIKEVMAEHVENCPVSNRLNVKTAVVLGAIGMLGVISTILAIIAYFHNPLH